MSRLLLVDDDPKLREGIHAGVVARGYECDTAEDVAEADARLDTATAYDLVLLDITLPDGSGWDVLERLRARGDETPVIFLTARHAPDDRVRGLRLGADDYVIKPFEFEELVARIEAVLRRHRPPLVYVIGDVRLDLTARRAWRGDLEVELSKREFDLVAALIEAGGEVLSRSALLERVWDMRVDPGTNVVDVVVSRVRKKLDVSGTHSIRTVVGEGYCVRAERVRA
ncbi:MAG: response regulator transcription factor [Planctomycetota bacterium]